MGKKKSRKKAVQAPRTQSQETKSKRSQMLPVYIIGGVILAGVLASGMISKFKRGDKRWGEPCSKTSECEEGICFPDNRGTSRCSPLCSSDKKCPIGYRCITKVNPKRKSIGMVSVCIEKP
jgi:hypothetical protein